MSTIESSITTRPARRNGQIPRSERPERIVIGGEEMVRNDVKAAEHGESEKTIDRRDKDGAPFIMIAGCKYRPDKRYDAFRLSQIKSAQIKSARKERSARASGVKPKQWRS